MSGVAGIIFDVKEFSVHDGPGPRTTVFFKGCPLRCRWCHNPEGQSFRPEAMVRVSRCAACGKCLRPCAHPECQPLGRCLHACPQGLVSACGEETDSEALAARLLRQADFWRLGGEGGVTVSGGEPLAQPEFLLDLLERLDGVHRCIETSGFAPPEVFRAAAEHAELVLMDVKLADSAKHREYTGVGNESILNNLEQLKGGDIPFIVRVPVIPGVNDDAGNLAATAGLLRGAKRLVRVELLPYNPFAGAKYPMLGREPPPDYGNGAKQIISAEEFTRRGISAVVD